MNNFKNQICTSMERINIAELLKDCPKGMELDCTMYDNVTLIQVREDNIYPIKIETPDGSTVLTKYGGVSYNKLSKCIIFPKRKTTWEGFVPPCEFKDGDVVVSRFGDIHLLRTGDSSYCAYRMRWTGATKLDNTITTSVEVARLATEEEKQILFDSIKANGYKWNEETKTLEKLINKYKFVIGAIITNGKIKGKISLRDGDSYVLEDGTHVFFNEVHNWELVPSKFDITTLKPFDKVLMRSSNAREWVATFYSHYSNNKFYGCGMCCDQCIPYEGNEHLRGTTNDCDEYYKTW